MADDEGLNSTVVLGATTDGPVDLNVAPLEELVGQRRYQLGDQIGKGGMGEIRASRDVVLNRHQAIKFTRTDNPAARARFVREARVQGQLEHPSIVPVHELGILPTGEPFFAMKWVRGVTLEHVLERLEADDPEFLVKFPRRRLLNAFQNVCLAIDFAHARRVLHRDLKPANIMLGDFGDSYVLDWGIAKRLDAPAPGTPGATPEPLGSTLTQTSDSGTQAGAVLGTPSYMPPEQVQGDPVDERADVFALGSVLFEILTLKKLVSGDSATEMMKATLAGIGAHARFRAPDRDIPPELEAICVKATSYDKQHRYPSARALHDELDGFLAGQRDEQLRTGLAQQHLTAARAAAAQARADASRASELRATAMREIGQALSLDPTNPRARRTLVSLLGTQKGSVPPEAREELERAAGNRIRRAGQLAAGTYASIFLYLPLLLWMGVREVRLLLAMYGAVVLSIVATMAVTRARKVSDSSLLLPLVASTVMVASLSFVMGPFVFLPSFAATNTAAFALLLPRQHRAFAIITGMMGVLVPVVAEAFGLVPNPLQLTSNGLTLLPQLAHFNPLPTMLMLTFSALGTVALAAVAVAELSDALRDAEERLATQAWNLRQLLPPEASLSTTGEHPMGSL